MENAFAGTLPANAPQKPDDGSANAFSAAAPLAPHIRIKSFALVFAGENTAESSTLNAFAPVYNRVDGLLQLVSRSQDAVYVVFVFLHLYFGPPNVLLLRLAVGLEQQRVQRPARLRHLMCFLQHSFVAHEIGR